jgi:protein-disulfide isomerase
MSSGKPTKSRRAAQEAARRRTRNIVFAVVIVVVVAIGIAVWASNRTTTDTAAAAPAGVDADLGIPVGTATSPVVDIYEDFQCPICKVLEDNVGATFLELADNGQARVVYHIMSFLDVNLSNDSSTRAANAAGCAQDQGVFPAYHREVFANQPANEGDGYTDEQLITFGESAGVPDMAAFEACVTNLTYADWVANVERLGEDAQISGTPTILLNGNRLDILGQATSWDEAITILKTAVTQAD